jgi:hypothetical protein
MRVHRCKTQEADGVQPGRPPDWIGHGKVAGHGGGAAYSFWRISQRIARMRGQARPQNRLCQISVFKSLRPKLQ